MALILAVELAALTASGVARQNESLTGDVAILSSDMRTGEPLSGG